MTQIERNRLQTRINYIKDLIALKDYSNANNELSILLREIEKNFICDISNRQQINQGDQL